MTIDHKEKTIMVPKIITMIAIMVGIIIIVTMVIIVMIIVVVVDKESLENPIMIEIVINPQKNRNMIIIKQKIRVTNTKTSVDKLKQTIIKLNSIDDKFNK